MLSPWVRDVGPRFWASSLARVAGLAPSVLASVHAPALRGEVADHALDVYSGLPTATGFGAREQEALDAAVSLLAA
jgi:hypothetical protein